MAGHLATPVRMSKWSLRTWHCRETSGMGHSEWPPAELLSQKPHVLFKQQFAQVNSAFLRYSGAAFCSMHNCMQWFVNHYHIKKLQVGISTRLICSAYAHQALLMYLSTQKFVQPMDSLTVYMKTSCRACRFEINSMCTGHICSHGSIKRRLVGITGNYHWKTM